MQTILGLDKTYNMIIVGGGKIGQALANYGGYDKLGFFIKAVFDKEVWHVRVPSHIDVFDTEKLADYTSKNKIDIAIICTPKEVALDAAQKIKDCGIKAIWNFAPTHLEVLANILVQNENMATSLAVLSMHLQAQIKDKK